MQLEETMVGVAADKAALIRDYSVEDSEQNLATVLQSLARMPHQDVLDFGRLAELLGYDRKLNTLDFPVAPRGYRVLGRVPRIPKLVIQKIIHELGGLEEVLAASDADLEAVDDVGRPGQGHPRGPAEAAGGRPGRPVPAGLTAMSAVAKRKEEAIPELDEAMEADFEEDVRTSVTSRRATRSSIPTTEPAW